MVTKEKVSFVLGSPDEKRKVVRFHGEDDDPMTSAYISKEALEKIGADKKVKITIEAA